jgi:hypothetical protein
MCANYSCISNFKAQFTKLHSALYCHTDMYMYSIGSFNVHIYCKDTVLILRFG